jgi:hypothetical protein
LVWYIDNNVFIKEPSNKPKQISMKKPIVFISTAAILIVAVLAILSFRKPVSGLEKEAVNPIIGTWQLDSYKYGTSSSSFTIITSDRPHIKLITENRFLWVTYDAGTKKVIESAGGQYTLNGEDYVESIDYGYSMDEYLGTKSKFKIKVEDGMFYLSGVLSDGYKIEEIWLQVK